MKKLILAMFIFVSCFATKAYSGGHGIKMGIILGFTGPIESLTPAMAASAEPVSYTHLTLPTKA